MDIQEDDLQDNITATEEGEDERLAEGQEMALPILPIRNTVLFPGVVIPLTVSREKSIKLVKRAYRSNDRTLGVITQRDGQQEDPGFEDLYQVGTVARILRMLVLPDGNTTIVIQGRSKFEVAEVLEQEGPLKAKVRVLKDSFKAKNERERKAVLRSLKDSAHKIIQLNPEIPQEARTALDSIQDTERLTYFLASNISVEVQEKQNLLEMPDVRQRADRLLEHLLKEVQLLELKQQIQEKVHSDIDQHQREYFLRQQIKVIQDELGDGTAQDVEGLKTRAKTKIWSESTAQFFQKHVEKLQRINPQAPEYPVAFAHCEFMTELPWQDYSQDNFDLRHAQDILDRDHFGLEKVKERIIEYLAVLKLKGNMRGPILCLYGPPGVGKTSLGKSIAQALGRKYIRMALGGLHDEAELRGHRRTYIGAQSGRILQNIKKAGSGNPVFILDEIDKLGRDFRGDPSSALLEVLDPEQNHSFFDNYLETEYDLSKVLFIATANSLDTIQPALRDRMEIIELSGYTQEEKLEIAKKHLIPKQVEEHGLTTDQVSIPDKVLRKVIDEYTRESGVRDLERKVGKIVRHVAKSIAMDETYERKISEKKVEKILGAPVFDREAWQNNELAGIVTGLAWTPVGGEILFVEASLNRGKGKLTLSGQLGEVMKESAITAISYLRAHADRLQIDHRLFDQYDLHIHVPAGAVPKDGPSAGITMLTAIASAFTQRKVRAKLAMTGEITLRGKVLPVGGIKEKILAAKRAGIVEILLCTKNQKDVLEIPSRYVEGLTIRYVETAQQVLQHALLDEKVQDPLDLSVLPAEKTE